MNEANEIEEEVETEARVEVETEKTPTPPCGRTKAAAARRQILTTPEKLFGNAEKMVEEEVKEPEEEGEKMVEEEVEEPEEEGEKMVEKEVVEPEEEAGKMVEEEVEEPEEEAGKMVVYEGSTCETKEADKGAAKPSGTGVKHRPKQMALRKHATKQAPKPRGRPRKDTEPKKFTTPEQTKRTRSRSQWVSTPFTEANTDEIEGRKKKPRTKA
ncbi:neurofilament medium polypeptide-like [Brassica napus]|nr:neurofilament medium polypeptide-like [Brassica napus]